MMQFYLQTVPDRTRFFYYFDAMRTRRVPISSYTYKLLLEAHAQLEPRDQRAFDATFSDLARDPKTPISGMHWAAAISAYGKQFDNLPRAIEIFEGIPHHPSYRGTIEAVVWEALLAVVCDKGTLAMVEAYHDRMLSIGTHLTAYIYNILITAYAKFGEIARSRELFASMGDAVPGVSAPNNHPLLFTSSGHVKPSTTTEYTGIVYKEPSTFETMVKMEMAYGSAQVAQRVLGLMQERGYPVAVFARARALIDGGGGGREARTREDYHNTPLNDEHPEDV